MHKEPASTLLEARLKTEIKAIKFFLNMAERDLKAGYLDLVISALGAIKGDPTYCMDFFKKEEGK